MASDSDVQVARSLGCGFLFRAVDGDGSVAGAQSDVWALISVGAVQNCRLARSGRFQAGSFKAILDVAVARDCGDREIGVGRQSDVDVAGIVRDANVVARRLSKVQADFTAFVGQIDPAANVVEGDIFVRGSKRQAAVDIRDAQVARVHFHLAGET